MTADEEIPFDILIDTRPLVTVFEDIYYLAKDFNESWIAFLDNEFQKDKNFYSQLSKLQIEDMSKLNPEELKTAGFTEDQSETIYGFFKILDDTLDSIEESLDKRSLEIFEKCSTFILYNYGYVMLTPYFQKKVDVILEKDNLPMHSTVLKLFYSLFRLDMDAGYEAYRADAYFVLKYIRNSLEILKNNLKYNNYIEGIIPIFQPMVTELLTPELMRKILMTQNLAGSGFFIIFWSALPRYYISLDSDETLNSFINEAITIDNENPLVLIIDGLRKMDENPIQAVVDIKKALDVLNAINVPGTSLQQSVGCFALALIYQRKVMYKEAESFFNQALSFSIPDFLRAIIILNRGKNYLDNNDLVRAKKDFLESQNYPHVEASAHVNLGKLYFIQNFLDKAEIELIKALELNPSLAVAYYNLGVLYNQKNDREKAKKYFQLTLQADGNFAEARTALKKLEESAKHLIDWWSWWFENSSASKKLVGIFSILLIGTLFIFAVYQLVSGIRNEFLNSYFIMIGFLLVFLILPTLTKLKIGPMEVEMKSVDSSAR